MNRNDLIKENQQRNSVIYAKFDPLTGEGAPLDRSLLYIDDFYIPTQYVPVSMLNDRFIQKLIKFKSIRNFIDKELKMPYTDQVYEEVANAIIYTRSLHDFAFWCYFFVKIKSKKGGDDIPFKLNRPQQKLVVKLEGQRIAGKPIRLILLKARQWGGSTAVQIYMAWIQLLHKIGWNSLIVGHVKDGSLEVKGMYTKLLNSYPKWMLYYHSTIKVNKNLPVFSSFEGAQNIDYIPARNSKVKVGTAIAPDSTRGGDSSMVHCTEVAFWSKTENKTPEMIVRSACSGVPYMPLSVEIYESTANGTGNFFHNEWVRATRGESDKEPLFISWFDIEMYSLEIEDVSLFAQQIIDGKNDTQGQGAYLWWLWQKGATLEALNWYIKNRKRYNDHADMAAEYPSDDIEAFKHSGLKVFDIYKVEALRKTCKPPIYIGEVIGNAHKEKEALANLRFVDDKHGALHIWELPDKEIAVRDRYVATVDIGGRSASADFTVISVIDRYWMIEGDLPVIVAEWRGHLDPDLIAWKAAQIAKFYNNALLVIESNTLETRNIDSEDHTLFILDEIALYYENLYTRDQSPEDIVEGKPRKYGFHTNRSTKSMIIDHLVAVVREKGYIERVSMCIDEYLSYEKKQNGSYGAIAGKHDDILMTRAIGLWIAIRKMDLPKLITKNNNKKNKRIITAATMP